MFTDQPTVFLLMSLVSWLLKKVWIEMKAVTWGEVKVPLMQVDYCWRDLLKNSHFYLMKWTQIVLLLSLLSKFNLFLDSLDFGLCLLVSGETPTLPLVFLVLFTGHLTLSNANLEHLANSLNSSWSMRALSRLTIRVLHLPQMYVGSPSSVLMHIFNKASILAAHWCSKPRVVNRLIALTLATKLLHSLQTRVALLEAIAT